MPYMSNRPVSPSIAYMRLVVHRVMASTAHKPIVQYEVALRMQQLTKSHPLMRVTLGLGVSSYSLKCWQFVMSVPFRQV